MISDDRLRELVASGCPDPDEVKAMVAEILTARPVVDAAAEYIGYLDAGEYKSYGGMMLRDLLRAGIQRHKAAMSLPDPLALRPCRHWQDTQQNECETCRKDNGR